MRLVVEDATSFKHGIDAIANIVKEGVFNITKDKISLIAMDPSLYSMVIFNMPKEAFSEYEVENERKIGLSIERMSLIMSRAKKGDKLVLEINDSDVSITFVQKSSKRTFKIPILDLPAEENIPNIQYKSKIVINAGALQSAIKDAKSFQYTNVDFVLTKDKFVVKAHGDRNEIVVEFSRDGEEIKNIECGENVDACFPLQYLDDITKACPSSEDIELYLNSTTPLKMKYNAGGASLTYFLVVRGKEEV